MVLRGILFSEEVTVSWRKLYNEELRNLYRSSNIMMGGECSTYGRAGSSGQNLSENRKRSLSNNI
jgi:hypothetical protein